MMERNARTRLVILGSGGGPAIHNNKTRLGPGNLVVVDGKPYLIDCGEAVPRQTLRAGVALADIDHVFITHQHFDHNSDLGAFLGYAWFAHRYDPVDVWGPPPLERIVRDLERAFSFDFELRETETGRNPFPPAHVHELALEGEITRGPVEIMRDDRVRVSAMQVQHGMVPSVALRFETADRVLVFSGDRGGQEDLTEFARGADVLVHEVIQLEQMERTFRARGVPGIEKVLEHFRNDHTTPEQVGCLATAAGVDTVVLNHILPDDDTVSDDEWERLAREHFDGTVLVGTDLLEV